MEWVQGALAQPGLLQRERIGLDLDEACAVLDSLPDLQSRSPKPTRSYATKSTKPSNSASNSTETSPRHD
jgi:hypothetical protein